MTWKTRISLQQGDITDAEVDVVVVTGNVGKTVVDRIVFAGPIVRATTQQIQRHRH